MLFVAVAFINLICLYFIGCFCKPDTINIIQMMVLPMSVVIWCLVAKNVIDKRKLEKDKKERFNMVVLPCAVLPTYILCALTLKEFLFYRGLGIEHLPNAASEVFSIGIGFTLGILLCVIDWFSGIHELVANKVRNYLGDEDQ